MSDVQRRHEHFMREAIAEAQAAGEAGDVPVGCVIVQGDEIIGRGGNEIQRTNDPTRHAEMVAIEDAVRTIGTKFLDDCTLYVTLEPCSMCAGAVVLSRIPTIVYGASDAKTGAVRSLFEIADDPRLNHRCIIRTGILDAECSALLTTFFRTSLPSTEKAPGNIQGNPSKLVLVPTPIGNLDDITKRALQALRDADVILCEDTRRTGQLLRHYGVVPKRLMSNHEHNERDRASAVVNLIRQGKKVALVSDAGMPAISDPGYRTVAACIEAGVNVEALPGPNALITAVAASGLPTDEVYFAGFPPQKKGRQTFLGRILASPATIVLYESPHRVERLLEEIVEVAGPDRRVVVARELSKMHEEYLRGTAAELVAEVHRRGGLKGECVVVVEGSRS